MESRNIQVYFAFPFPNFPFSNFFLMDEIDLGQVYRICGLKLIIKLLMLFTRIFIHCLLLELDVVVNAEELYSSVNR